MRIWIVSVGEPLPCDGANTRLRRMGNLASYLSNNQENQIDWFSVSFDHYKKVQRVKKDTTFDLKENYHLHLVRVNGYKRNVSIFRIIHHKMAAKRIYKKMTSIKDKPDVIIASMEPLEISRIATHYAHINNIPSIVDVRDLWPEIYYEVLPKSLHWLLNIYVKKSGKTLSKTMDDASAIVGLSSGFLDYGLKYAKRSKNEFDSIIPIGYRDFDLNNYKANYSLINEKYGLSKDDFVVLFLGNFGNQFDFKPIIKAAELLKNNSNIKFVLCGLGLQLEELKKKTDGLNIIYTGWIEQDTIKYLAANSQLGIAPYINSMNYTLNTPNKFGEYLSYGLPIVLGVEGLMNKIAVENKCGCSYSNGIELSEIVLEFYNNRNKLKELSKNARNLFEKTFDEKYTNVSFESLIKRLINKKEEK